MKTFIQPIEEIIRETNEAVTLRLAQPLVDRVNYLPGQYLTIKVEIDGETYYRSYSMSSTPGLDRYLAVTVKRTPDGLVSNYINDRFYPGRLLEYLRPAGHFTLETSVQNERHLILIGGGSGITPLMSILKALLFNEPKSQASLIYANRNEGSIIFKEQLQELLSQFPQRFHLLHVLSQPSQETSVPHQPGRITAENLPDLLGTFPDAPNLPKFYYICGPSGMMQAAEEALHGINISSEAIFQERFVADEEITATQGKISGPTRQVELVLGKEEFQIQVPPGLSILQAALAQGLRLPYSCRRGICSTCMSRIERGEVKMDNPESLLDFEVQKGLVLTCQAHPLTDDVRILVGEY